MLDLSRLNGLGEALRDATYANQTRVALIEANRDRENGRWTYQDLRHEGDRVAALLQAQGLKPGDSCAILMSNQARWILSALGVLWAGGILMPLDYKLSPEEQWALMKHGKPTVLITEYGIWRRLEPARKTGPKALQILVTEAPQEEELGKVIRWEESAEAGEPIHPETDDVASIVYSSGTGGTPKGCMLTHKNYLAQAEVLGQLFPMVDGDRYFSILPTNHAIDFMCGFVLPLLFGSTVVHQRTLRPQYLASTMKRYGVTHMALVPMILKAFEARIREKLEGLPPWQARIFEGLQAINEAATRRKPNHALSSRVLKPIHDGFGGKLKLLFCGGAFVERETAQFFYSLGIPVVIGYGLTEAGTVVTVNDLKPFRADSVGKPIPGTRIQIRDENPEGIGQVWVSGPTIMKGYLHEEEKTADILVDGWLSTGDLGFLDAAGHLKLKGRVRNMIVTEGGKNIYPEDVETAFSDLPGSHEHCVFAANYVWPKAEMTGEILTLVVHPEEGTDPVQIRDELNQRNRALAEHKRVASFVLWEEDFPRTASMKIKRHELAQAIREGASRDAALRSVA